MILADTSVWVEHLRSRDERLEKLLLAEKITIHPFITGEIALGNLRNRQEIIVLMQSLPQVLKAEESEVLRFISDYSPAGSGVGYIGVHLLASARLSSASIWTYDTKLAEAASRLGLKENF